MILLYVKKIFVDKKNTIIKHKASFKSQKQKLFKFLKNFWLIFLYINQKNYF